MGSKAAPVLYQKIINIVPAGIETFIEPFAGEAHISRIMAPTKHLILVDKVRQPGLPASVMARANFVQGCGIAFCEAYKFKGKEFIYADPPYHLPARGHREYYEHEMPERDQRRWLRVVTSINCRVAMSGYHSPLYDDALKGWNSREIEVMTRAGTKAIEVLWWNYETPTQLHDWRHVGECWEQRRNLTKKIRRAVHDLLNLPPLHRGRFFHELSAAMTNATRAEVLPAIPGRAGLATAAPSENGREVLGIRAPAVRPELAGGGAGVPRPEWFGRYRNCVTVPG